MRLCSEPKQEGGERLQRIWGIKCRDITVTGVVFTCKPLERLFIWLGNIILAIIRYQLMSRTYETSSTFLIPF